ncbi:hypothetical protein [Neorhodopirellula lusitana]|uniref:hypothetical protein n=1 Tax=Neorhodopirellula lusitana TaxID=445327 RepID=UPI0024B78546|nr:hypothetical protein [Neorhodopirellula lusitana]
MREKRLISGREGISDRSKIEHWKIERSGSQRPQTITPPPSRSVDFSLAKSLAQ